jgi:hypothetical protein
VVEMPAGGTVMERERERVRERESRFKWVASIVLNPKPYNIYVLEFI